MRFFDSDLEKKILSYCFSSKEAIAKLVKENLIDNFYDTTARALFVAARKVFRNHNIALTGDILDQILAEQNVDEVKANLCRVMLMEAKALDVSPDVVPFYIEQLKSYNLRRKIYEILNNSITSIDQLESKEILGTLLQQLTPLQRTTQDIPLVERFVYEQIAERKKLYIYRKENPKDTQGLLFGFKGIDELTNGICKKEVALFYGRTNVGKSRVLFNVAYNLAKAGSSGILFSLEMYINQLERLFDSLGAGISYTLLKKGLLPEEDEKKYFAFLEETQKNKPPLYLIDYSSNCTPSFIQSVIRERKKYQQIDWICLDYLTLMEPDEKYQTETSKYGSIGRELKQLAKSEDIAIITASQSNRESIKAKKAGTEHVSFSDQIAHHMDLMIHLKQSEEQVLQQTLEMNIVKYRDGEAHKQFFFYCNWDKSIVASEISLGGEGNQCNNTTDSNLKNPSENLALPPTGNEAQLF